MQGIQAKNMRIQPYKALKPDATDSASVAHGYAILGATAAPLLRITVSLSIALLHNG